jgi:hypothetical protein
MEYPVRQLPQEAVVARLREIAQGDAELVASGAGEGVRSGARGTRTVHAFGGRRAHRAGPT